VIPVIFVVVAALGVLLALAAMRPNSFRVERSTTIVAPAEKVFALINDFHQWAAWSPWEKLDPALKRSYGGAAAGKGAIYEWEGNSKAGTGRMEIIDAAVPSGVRIKLDFIKPFKAQNTAEFTLEPQGGSTHVSWAMFGPSPFVTKIMGVFVSMDALVGKDFEKGLAHMKAAAEQ
jgi:uncharacterized protein YndB with AHSA1/START domain